MGARLYQHGMVEQEEQATAHAPARLPIIPRRELMATQPPTEVPPQPTQPAQPDAPPPEIAPPGPDFDQPSPGTPSGDPGTGQPAEI